MQTHRNGRRIGLPCNGLQSRAHLLAAGGGGCRAQFHVWETWALPSARASGLSTAVCSEWNPSLALPVELLAAGSLGVTVGVAWTREPQGAPLRVAGSVLQPPVLLGPGEALCSHSTWDVRDRVTLVTCWLLMNYLILPPICSSKKHYKKPSGHFAGHWVGQDRGEQ